MDRNVHRARGYRWSRRIFEKEKGVVLEELKMEADNPEYLVHEIFSNNFWRDHPLGKPILGTRETVRSFDRGMIENYLTLDQATGAYRARADLAGNPDRRGG